MDKTYPFGVQHKTKVDQSEGTWQSFEQAVRCANQLYGKGL